MKKVLIGILLSGIVLVSGYNRVVEAADTTDIQADVIAGDTIFTIDKTVAFGEQPLAAEIVFPQKTISFKVVDFSGNDYGCTVQAAITNTNENAKLAVGGTQLSTTNAEVINIPSLSFGDNLGSIDADLELTGVDKLGQYTEVITWVFQKNTSPIVP